MREKAASAVLAMVVLGACRVALATTIYDHFDDPGQTGHVDPALWVLPSADSVASSSVTLAAGTVHGWNQMHSTASFDSRTTNFEYKLTSYAAPEDGVYMGVITDDGLGMGTWVECRAGVWQMEIYDSAHDVRSAAFTAPKLGDLLGITRIGDVFTATVNGTAVATEAITGSMDNNVRLWLGVSCDRTGGGVLSIDYAGTATIPEPSTLILLSLAVVSVIAYVWRKRR